MGKADDLEQFADSLRKLAGQCSTTKQIIDQYMQGLQGVVDGLQSGSSAGQARQLRHFDRPGLRREAIIGTSPTACRCSSAPARPLLIISIRPCPLSDAMSYCSSSSRRWLSSKLCALRSLILRRLSPHPPPQMLIRFSKAWRGRWRRLQMPRRCWLLSSPARASSWRKP